MLQSRYRAAFNIDIATVVTRHLSGRVVGSYAGRSRHCLSDEAPKITDGDCMDQQGDSCASIAGLDVASSLSAAAASARISLMGKSFRRLMVRHSRRRAELKAVTRE
jgi:hypothetical protein